MTARRRLSATQGPPARAFFWSLRIPSFTLVAAALAACPGQAPEVAPKSARDAAGAGPAAVRAPRDTAMEQRVARLELRLLERDALLGGKLTVSVGVAQFPADGESPDELLAGADAALYQAKREGRNRVLRAVR